MASVRLASPLGRRTALDSLVAFVFLVLVGWPGISTAATRTVEHRLSWSEADVRIEDGTVRLQGGGALGLEGRPDLPIESVRWAVPSGTRVSRIDVRVEAWSDLGPADGLRGVPALVDPEGQVLPEGHPGDRTRWGEAGENFPPVAAELTGTQMLRGWSLATVDLFPVRVNAEGRLELARAIQVRMELEIDPASNEQVRRRVEWPGVRDNDSASVRSVVRNVEEVSTYAPPRGLDPSVAEVDFSVLQEGLAKVPRPVEGPIDYLILTVPALEGEFQRLADLRTEEGLRTEIVTVDQVLAGYRAGGDQQETLRLFLRHAYEEWGTSYVLLGGDAELIPPRYARSRFYPVGSFTDIPTDLYYSCLDGNWNSDADGIYAEAYQDFLNTGDGADMLAELSLGRAPLKTASQVSAWVDKVLSYNAPADRAYVARALFLSEVLFPQNWDGIANPTLDGAVYSENIIFNSIIGGSNLIESWRLYENYSAYFGASVETKNAAMDSMQSGRFGIVNHVGHGFYYNMSVGDNNIFVADVDQLQNGLNAFFLYALNCSSGAFDFDCLLERFLQNEVGGAVACVGSSRAAFPTTADVYQQYFYEEVFLNGIVRAGDAQLVSRARNSASTNVEGSHRWTHLTYHLFADPTMRLWRAEPRLVGVTHDPDITLGAASLTVDVGNVAGATVSLTRADGGFVTGTTDGSGTAVLDLAGLSDRTGSVRLNVAGSNLMPYTSDLPVQVGSGPHVRATVEAMDDGSVAPSNGDGDGLAEAGETVQWSLRFENDGDGSNAPNVNAQLVPVAAAGATLVVDTIAVGGLSGATSTVPSDNLVLDLAPTILDGTRLVFDLIVTSGGNSWTQPLELVVQAPQLEVARIRWDDAALGNGDGIIDAGETFDLFVELVNYGAGESNSLDGTLVTSSPNVTLVQATNSWTAMGLKSVSEGAGSFRLSESDVGVENWIRLDLADDQGRSWTHWLELRPPAAPPAPETDTSFGPDRIALRMAEVFEPHFYGYRVYRSTTEAGPYVEITPDRVEGTGFYMDAGLASLTRYYYEIAVVDSSGVESAPGPPAQASTSPPEMAGGFPIPFNRELAGAIAVGDVRGDGGRVVAYGSDYVYAIDSQGNELVNGDNDSQTLGPLGGDPQNPRFTPSGVSMADLDGDGKMEIVASNWDSRDVWILQDDGSSLPGWPRPMNNRSWATPVIADLDANGDLEIIVNNVGSRLYVWNHDGSEFLDGDNDPSTDGVFQIRTGEQFNRSSPAVYDLDGDGHLEMIFGTHFRDGSDNWVYALKTDGTNAAGWPKNMGPGGYSVGHATIADLDGDGTVEIVHVNDDDHLYVWRPDGSLFPGFPISFVSQAVVLDTKAPAVALGDFDKNGDLEMVAVSTITRSRAEVFILDHDGSVWPGWPREVPGLSESSPLVGDLNGDLSLDIVYGIGGGTDNSPNVLYAFNADGTDVQGFPITLPGAVRAVPVIDDFDQDGDVDVVYAGFDRFLHVWDMPFPFHPHLVPWGTFQANNRRTGVYLEDQVTASLVAEIFLRPTSRGLVLEGLFSGAPTTGLRLHVERRELDGEPSPWLRLAEGLQVEGGQLTYRDEQARAGRRYEYRLVDEGGSLVFRSEPVTVPALRAALHPNVPNPFNPSTRLRFEVPGTAGALVPTQLEIFDLSGRRVRVLHSGPIEPGTHELTWNGRDEGGAAVGSGVYFARLRCAGEERSLKMTLVK